MISRFLSKKNKSGFTLLETLVAIGIGLVATAVLFHIFTFGLKAIRTIQNTESLHSEANFLLNTFTYWIKQGGNVTTSGSTLEIEFPDSSITTIATSSDDRITLDGTPITSDNIKVTDLNFTKMSRSVQIRFTIEAKSGDETFSATTTIAQRGI
jgi:prepilin-type N-terminal cleavage/methylation domain-containing protein